LRREERIAQERIQHLFCQEREFFIVNLLVRIHFIIVMIWWTGLAPWEFEFPFPREERVAQERIQHLQRYLAHKKQRPTAVPQGS